MPTVIRLKNGEVKTLLSTSDFEELVDKHMGWDAVKYLRGLSSEFEDMADECRTLREEIADLEEKYESQQKARQ